MEVQAIRRCIGTGNLTEAENLWMAGLDQPISPKDVGEILSTLVEKDKVETAEALGWALISEKASAGATPAQLLPIAKAALLAVPSSAEILSQVAEMYRAVHGQAEHFDAIYEAAGLEKGQSPRRALRTLDACLSIRPGMHMANRFEDRVILIEKFNDGVGEYEFTAGGMPDRLEPKKLTDEFDVLDDGDFRVLRLDAEALQQALQKEPQRVLVGVCLWKGGEVTSDALRDLLVPKYLAKDKWTGWWGRARTAAKKTDLLTVEGRNPVTIQYHPHGRTLEEEFAGPLAGARAPLDFLRVLRDYVGEAKRRNLPVDAELAGRCVSAMAEQARTFAGRGRFSDALEAALAAEVGVELGGPPASEMPKPGVLLAEVARPVQVIAELPDSSLWPAALRAVRSLDEAVEVLSKLFLTAPAEYLDAVREEILELGGDDPAADAAAKAGSDPSKYVDVCVWLWNGPARPVEGAGLGRVNLLLRFLQVLHDVDHHWDGDQAARKDVRQRIRSALSARDYAAYEEALEETDESMARVVKGKIERTDGLAQTVSDEMLHRLRQKHPKLFLQEKLPPWLDERFIFTTADGLHRRAEELRVLKEVTMPANAKQIGEAAAQGDLRENADWQAAIEERDMLVALARKITEELARARTITAEEVPAEVVGIGSRVTLRKVADGTELVATFLGPWDGDVEKRLYSYTSGLGMALMGKPIGETVEIKLEGLEGEYRIESLAPGV